MIILGRNQCLAVICLLIIAFITYWLYLPGINGGFLFDDYPNLEDLGTYGGVVDFETFKNFVFNGISGPSGRPISLASFLLDDNTWPSYPYLFKDTNIKIHLITGLALALATLQLMRVLGYQESRAVWIAVLSSAIWMLHPYMVSTTLYIVQRMAQLAAMFMFFGLAVYFYGRNKLNSDRWRGYLWMTVGVSLFTILAFFSKENGLLLPLTILAIEICIPRNQNRPINVWWKLVFLWLPSLIIIVYLLSLIRFTLEPWPGRSFSQIERLITEPRILWEYLFHLYVPRIEGRGLFQDGYVLSKGLSSPVITLPALVGLVAFIICVFVFRRRYPILGIAFLFFFASHILESTLVNLELYFEHRNYASSAFLFLPIAVGLVKLPEYIKPTLAVLCALLLLFMLSFLTYKRVDLWSNAARLEMYWAVATPSSPRASNRIGILLLQQNRVEESKAHFANAVKRFPQSSLININSLLIRVYIREATEEDFVASGLALHGQPFDAQAVKALRALVEKVTTIENRQHYVEYTLALLEKANDNPHYSNFPMFKRLYFYLKGQLYIAVKDPDQSYKNFDAAISLYDDTDAALSMVAEVSNAGYFVEASKLLDHTKHIYKHQPKKTLKRSEAVYDYEINRIGNILQMALESQRESEIGKQTEHNNSSKE